MKFLCLTCDTQMNVAENRRQRADGTMAIVLECPECFGQFGMLTNPMETKLLDSLDVSVCPVGGKNRAAESTKAEAPAGMPWSVEAEARLGNVPAFARAAVRESIEQFARDRGHAEVTAQVMSDARVAMGL